MNPSALFIAASVILLVQSSPTPCAETNSKAGGDAAALRPSNVLLAITSPRAGEMVSIGMPQESVSVTVDYWGPHLVAPNAARKIDDDHLVFFLDTDDNAYVGTLAPTPRCNPNIVHTATTSATFYHVMHGGHAIHVLLVGSNDVSVNPPVAAMVSFVTNDQS